MEIYCKCGCGKEATTRRDGTINTYLRGHHMRKQGGYKPPSTEDRFCECGCGTRITPMPNGQMRRFIKYHRHRGVSYTLEQRKKRSRLRYGCEPIVSPYIEDAFVRFDKKMKRWRTSVICRGGKNKSGFHANLVYRHYFGEIPKGNHVHHKDGKHEKLTDDRPENLMLLPSDWNLRFFPTLAKGFGVPEQIVTDFYCSLLDDTEPTKLFSLLCEQLIKQRKQK